MSERRQPRPVYGYLVFKVGHDVLRHAAVECQGLRNHVFTVLLNRVDEVDAAPQCQAETAPQCRIRRTYAVANRMQPGDHRSTVDDEPSQGIVQATHREDTADRLKRLQPL